MKLSEWLRKYRQDNGYTLRDLSRVTGLAYQYLGALEKNKANPSTGKPYTPSVEALSKLAAGTQHTFEELAAEVEDVNLPTNMQIINDDEKSVLSGYRKLNFDNRRAFKKLLSTFLTAQSATAMAGA